METVLLQQFLNYMASQLSQTWLPPLSVPENESLCICNILPEVSLQKWRELIQLSQNSQQSWCQVFSKFPDKDAFISLVRQHINYSYEHDIRCIVYRDIHYPKNLYSISDPPLCLNVKGHMDDLNTTTAIIGARKATHYAQTQSFLLACHLATMGQTIVSGGAFGCDMKAHQGALAASNGRTLVVFAGGLQQVSPRSLHHLFRKILEKNGAWISEKLHTAPAYKSDFRPRNRLISGLSQKVFVMQAAKRSGAYMTANMALDQGRDVFVLQQQAHSDLIAGSQELILDGAHSFSHFKELINVNETSYL